MTEPDTSVIRHGDALEVHWPSGKVSRLPYLWLRDNCQCEQCRVAQTTEKRFMISDVPVDIAPLAVSLQDDRLVVVWPDGHETAYEGRAIAALNVSNAHVWSQWESGFSPPRCPFDAFLDDDTVAADAIADFLDTGAFILEQAPTQPGTLELLAPRLGPIREVLFARIHDVRVDSGGYNVAHTSIALPPHNDFASYSWPPSVQALHMLENEAAGGESVIVDGWQVLTRLRDEQPQFFKALCDMPVPFREFDDDNETFAIAPMVRCDTGGEIVSLRFSNQLMQTLDPEAAGVGEFYRAYHALCGMITDDEFKVSFRLHGGDILVVAAHRVLHGREAFESSGRRHLQDAYFELDNVRNHLVVLNRKRKQAHD
jgi:gamma-butyrobetaine dioxygenase